jgi:DNA-binding transcriptional regulator YiaG
VKTVKTKKVAIEVGKLRFTADLALKPVSAFPGKDMVSAADLERFEQAVARWLIENGVTGHETIKVLRSAAGLTATELANLLGINKSRVSEWESGKHDPGVSVWMTLADLALETMKTSVSARARLEAIKAYPAKRITREIKLSA